MEREEEGGEWHVFLKTRNVFYQINNFLQKLYVKNKYRNEGERNQFV